MHGQRYLFHEGDRRPFLLASTLRPPHRERSAGGSNACAFSRKRLFPFDSTPQADWALTLPVRSGCDCEARAFPVPWQQFGDAAGWVIGQSCEHVGEPRLRINIHLDDRSGRRLAS
jgi:hypothetical protein